MSDRGVAKRIRVEGAALVAVVGVGVLTGIVAVLVGLSPTGAAITDTIVVVTAVSAAVWASASAPWWILAAAAGTGAVLAGDWPTMVVGGGAFVAALRVGTVKRSRPLERSVVAAATIIVLSTARELNWWGVNAAVAIAVVVAVSVAGLARRSRADRRIGVRSLIATGAVTVVAVLGMAAMARSAQQPIVDADDAARRGIRQLSAGEFDAARLSFTEASGDFARAEDFLSAPWGQPARLVPVVSQHRSAAVTLASQAATATATLADELATIDLDSLRIVDGRIDIDAVGALREPMRALQAALDDVGDAVDDSLSGWLLPPVRDRLSVLADEIAVRRTVGERVEAALDIAPTVLGADGERVYFVMFTTPAEARGQGGFMGNWAELSVDGGRIEMTRFGRTGDLNSGGDRPRILTGPQDWLASYGRYGFQKGPDAVVGAEPWSNITMSPHFPSTAQVVAELYPQSGGRPIDGVISLDVDAVAAVMSAVGPVDVPGGPTLTAANATRFLLVDQYELDDGDIVDALEGVAVNVMARFLAGDADDPLGLGRALVDPAREGRLLMWAADPDVQSIVVDNRLDGRLFRHGEPTGTGTSTGTGIDTGAVGSLPDRETLELSLRFQNVAPNKIDVYLDRQVCVRRNADTVVVEATITNTAPADGLPDVVLGNQDGYPNGTNRSRASVFASAPISDVTVDGRRPPFTNPGTEAGAFTVSFDLAIGPGRSSQIRFVVDDPSATRVRATPHPLVLTERWSVANPTCTTVDDVTVSWTAPL